MDPEDLAFAGAVAQARLVREREVGARELAEVALARIERLQPMLNCFTAVKHESALQEAEAVQLRLVAGDAGPLAGVPVAVKDNTDVAGVPTSHGVFPRRPAAEDSLVVRRLRDAGAVIVGKTTLPELAQWGHFTSSATWGITRNPWDPSRSPGGSSGGTAAAVAAGLAGVGLGSDGGCSIRVPAAACGLFGIKPQRGRIPMLPDVDHWFGLTHFGPLARTVADAALFLDVAAGTGDACAKATATEPRPLRIGVWTATAIPMRLAPGNRRAVDDVARLLAGLGHRVSEVAGRPAPAGPWLTPRYLAGIREDVRRVGAPERLENRTRRMAAAGERLGGRALTRALAGESVLTTRLNAAFADHDILLTPVSAAPLPAADHGEGKGAVRTFREMLPWAIYTGHWNGTGQPAASVPAGFDADGMPTAVQLVAPPEREDLLFSLAAQLETARPWAQHRPQI